MGKVNRTRAMSSLRVLSAAALLVAMSIVCGKYLAIRGGDILRFSFENLPILLAGMAFGPAVGVSVAVVADLLGCLLVGYAINPLVTLGAAAIGLLSGVLYRLLAKLPYGIRLGITVAASHFVGSAVIKTVGLAAFYSMPLWQLMLWRLLNYAIVGGLETVLLYIILKNKTIQSQLTALRR